MANATTARFPAGMPAGVFLSKKDTVLAALHAAIASGQFRPGERLIIDELAANFGVSSIPVREALQQLQAEGFVAIQPHVGATVTTIEPQLIIEIFEMLEALELIAGREACKRMSEDDFAHMETLLRRMDNLNGDLEAWSEANTALHQFICDCAGMPLVKSTLVKVLDHWKRLRSIYMKDVFAVRVRSAQREHWQMVRALRACDVERFEKVVRAHNRAARNAYTEHFKKALRNEKKHP
jgi:DNA-binding GntR family transcriptional regulator